MSKYQRREFQVGEWFLGTKAGRPGWFRCKFEDGQTRRISLGTLDVEEAKQRLTAWFLAEQQGLPPYEQRATLAEILVAYDEAHGQHVASAADVKISSRLWADYFGDIGAAEVDVDRIDKFKRWLSAKDYSPGYINRVLSVGRAALMRAFERRVIPRRPVVKGVAGHEPEPKGRPMSVPELKALYAGLHEPHLRRFFLLGLGTGARPGALKTLEWPQV